MKSILTVLAAGALLFAAQPQAEAKFVALPMAREVRVPELKGAPADGKVDAPTVITSADELEKVVKDADARKAILNQVNFKRDKLVYFAWSGSGGDKLTVGAGPNRNKPELTFRYQAGATDDLVQHHRLFAVPVAATWKVAKGN